jgi:predicted DNA-binding transcriptional regulator AlpA
MNQLATVEIPDEAPRHKWLNLRQLMEIVPFKKSRIYYLTHIGAIPHHKVGQTLFFREDEIVKWMEGYKVQP